jgi:hypothetical protein
MKLPATRFIPVKMEIGWQPASEGAQAFERRASSGGRVRGMSAMREPREETGCWEDRM